MTVDEAIKQIDPNMLVCATDYFDFSQAYFVSKNDKVEDVLATDQQGSNDRAFQLMSKRIKQEMGDRPVIVGAIDATHYNFVNKNVSFYMNEYLVSNAKTWIVNSDGIKWGKPIQIDHDSSQEKTLGRVLVATPFKYPNPNPLNLVKPDGHIELIYYVSDTIAIERIIDGRYQTMSVSAASKPDNVTCSICGLPISNYECDHYRGKVYEVERDGKNKKELCYWKWTDKEYTESSYITRPADSGAVQKKTSFINIPGIEASDDIEFDHSILAQDKEQVEPPAKFSIMIGDISPKSISNIVDQDGRAILKEQLVMADSIAGDQLAIIDAVAESTVQYNSTMGQEDESAKSSDTDCPSCGDDAQHQGNEPPQEEDASDILDRNAALGLLLDIIEDGLVDIDDAAAIAYEHAELYIPQRQRTGEKVKDFLLSMLEERDAALTTAKRKKLKSSTFCGPNRSWPVPDCEHVRVARAYLSNPRVTRKYSSSKIARIRACVNRKAKALGCPSSKKNTKDHTAQEAQSMELKFASSEELLASQIVQKHVDELVTKHEQAMDELKTQHDEETELFRNIAVDEIIKISLDLNKPIVAKIKDASGDDEIATARKEVVEKLSARPLDVLKFQLEDLNEESAAHTAKDKGDTTDPNQKAVDDALNGKNGADSKKEGTSDKPNTADDKNKPAEGADNTSTSKGNEGKPPEDINQTDANTPDSEGSNTLSSFTREIK